MNIDKVTLEDLKELRECNIRNLPVYYSLSEYLDMFNDSKTIILVAKYDGKILGYIIGNHEKNNQFHIISFAVDKEYRKNGLGTSLMNSIEKQALIEYPKLLYTTLNVDVSNHAAIQFYIKYGFKKVSELPHYYGWFQNGYKLGKKISK